jgi:poly(hydroxyalkanoate) depolymerase family esterase
MPAKPQFDMRGILRLPNLTDLAKAALPGGTLLRSLRTLHGGGDRPSRPVARGDVPGLGTVADHLTATPAMRELLDRFATFKPGAGLCGMTVPAGSRAAPALPEGARFEAFTFRGGGREMAYKLYVPSTYGSQALPLVVMLHGCTQSPDDFAAGTRMNEIAEEQGVLVAYPGQAASANAQKCWNWFDAKDQHRDHGEPALIAGLTREVMRDFAVDPARVYVAGLSAGGAAAAIVAQAYPDIYAAAGVHSGLASGAATDMPSAFAAMRQGGIPRSGGRTGRPVPTIVFHGDRDRTVHPSNGEHVLTQAKAGAALTTTVTRGEAAGGLSYTRTVQSDGAGSPTLERWVLHGAGHAWSGGSQAGSYTEPRGPDASREMLRFFLAHANSEVAA